MVSNNRSRALVFGVVYSHLFPGLCHCVCSQLSYSVHLWHASWLPRRRPCPRLQKGPLKSVIPYPYTTFSSSPRHRVYLWLPAVIARKRLSQGRRLCPTEIPLEAVTIGKLTKMYSKGTEQNNNTSATLNQDNGWTEKAEGIRTTNSNGGVIQGGRRVQTKRIQ